MIFLYFPLNGFIFLRAVDRPRERFTVECDDSPFPLLAEIHFWRHSIRRPSQSLSVSDSSSSDPWLSRKDFPTAHAQSPALRAHTMVATPSHMSQVSDISDGMY